MVLEWGFDLGCFFLKYYHGRIKRMGRWGGRDSAKRCTILKAVIPICIENIYIHTIYI